MRKPFRVALAGSQTNTSKVLLAHLAEGHPVLRKGMQQMLMIQQHHSIAIRAAYPNERSLAIRSIRAQHNWILSHGNASDQIPCCRN